MAGGGEIGRLFWAVAVCVVAGLWTNSAQAQSSPPQPSSVTKASSTGSSSVTKSAADGASAGTDSASDGDGKAVEASPSQPAVSAASTSISKPVDPAFYAAPQHSNGSAAVKHDSQGGTTQSISLKTDSSISNSTEPLSESEQLKSDMGKVLRKLDPKRLLELRQFEKAKMSFTGFCKDWGHKLDEREVNNREHIAWHKENGQATGTYTGYSPIESCTCKQAHNGVPLGEITYHELSYTVSGKDIKQAKKSPPKAVNSQSTMEIFSWDKGKWSY